MAAEGLGQAVARTEKIDGSGLTVIVAEDRGLALLIRRKRVVNASDRSDLLPPGKFVGVILGEWRPDKAALSRLSVQERTRLVAYERFHGQHGKNQGQRNRDANDHPGETNRLESGAP